MNQTDRTYRSILDQLARLPSESLPQVKAWLDTLVPLNGEKEDRRRAILEFAGSWDMSEDDFEDYLKEAHRAGNRAFGGNVDL